MGIDKKTLFAKLCKKNNELLQSGHCKLASTVATISKHYKVISYHGIFAKSFSLSNHEGNITDANKFICIFIHETNELQN